MTKTVGIREVTRHTSKVIHEAAAGETVVITEHDQPIAMLVPLPSTGDPVVDQLIREGKLSPASNPGGMAALLAIRPHPHSPGSLPTAAGWPTLPAPAAYPSCHRPDGGQRTGDTVAHGRRFLPWQPSPLPVSTAFEAPNVSRIGRNLRLISTPVNI